MSAGKAPASTTPAADLPTLSRGLPSAAPAAAASAELPERVLQFGEGNFLRAFVDWMLHRMNQRGLFGGRAVLVQPIAHGLADAINAQDGLYTVVLRGLADGQVSEARELVTSVSRCLDPYRDFDALLACARNPDLRFVVSNTTEAGIRTDDGDALDARPAISFPGKLTQVLYQRFRHFDGDPARGLVMLPCELIERNGDNLRKAVATTAASWKLPAAFGAWVDSACVFTNTLVDRIVTGYPKEDAAELEAALGYRDRLLVTGEPFHCWVIEAPDSVRTELPLTEAGLDVVWTADMTPYRERKVRILNGAHTMSVLAAYLMGKNTVRELMDDELLRGYVQRGLDQEILPTLKLPRADVEAFARAVSERFANPFIKHYLTSIALNSVSKYKARILGTVMDHARAHGGQPPARLSFALAALIAFYRGREIRDGALIGHRDGVEYRIEDDAAVLTFFAEAWAKLDASGSTYPKAAACRTLVEALLGRTDFWGANLDATLPALTDVVAGHLHAILSEGPRAALARIA